MSTSPSSPDQALRPSRRSVLRTAAWTMPAIAVAAPAPAFAASPCPPTTFDFTTVPTGTRYASGSVITTYGGIAVSLQLSGTAGAGNDGTPNSSVFNTTASTKELRFYDANTPSTSQTIALNFTSTATNLAVEVKNLTVTYIDVDRATNYDDRLIVNTAGFGAAVGSQIQGNGTSANPYRSTVTTSAPDGSANATVALTWPSTSTASVTYLQGTGTTTGFPHIGIRTITFTAVVC